MKSHSVVNLMQLGLASALLSVFLAGSVTPTVAQTAEPPRKPMLRIETGMHSAPINQIGVDRAGKFLVTASDDKTVRVWELPSGTLLRILRPPIGAANEGQMNAVAISPEGSTIAASQRTEVEWDKTRSIYIFDRESGRLIRRIGGLPSMVTRLAYSPDGQYLAATLSGKNGVRVYHLPTYALAGEDRNYGDSTDDADFDQTGRLVTLSYDRFVRLYTSPSNGRLRLLAKYKLGPGYLGSVSFSPDGSRVAVGYSAWPRVEVLKADGLSLLYKPEATAIGHISETSPVWSTNGDTLFAVGRAGFIRAWEDGGRGPNRDMKIEGISIQQILPLPDGGFIFRTGDLSFGSIDAAGKIRFLTEALTAKTIRNPFKSFLAVRDGSVVQFGYQSSDEWPVQFSITDRRLDTTPIQNTSWRAPITPADFTPPFNFTRPIRGCLGFGWASAPDKSMFLLGAESLCLLDGGSALRWRVPAPSLTFGVDISGDGRLAVAAFLDGTIRWYRITDGKELLAFFPHVDRKRWILWTPSGYYDASPGGEDLIGWHINNGKDAAADFFPAGRFRSTFYRPDIVSRILEAGDEAAAVQLANGDMGAQSFMGALLAVSRQGWRLRPSSPTDLTRILPPVVEIVSPPDASEISSSEVVLRYDLRTPSGEPVNNIRVLVNGRPIVGGRQLLREPDSGSARAIKVSVPEQDSEIALIAENRFAASVPAMVRLKWRGAPTTGTFVIKPKLYVLAVGISAYANPSYNLKFAAKDARDFAAAVATQKGLL